VIGRLKSGPEKLLVEDYVARAAAAGRSLGLAAPVVHELAESRREAVAERLAEEAQRLTAALPPRVFKVVLDDRGKVVSSAGFADLLKRHLDGGTSDLAFLIGGPDGHAQSIRDSAGLVLSFGAMTWPHRLARVMLAEQIYRAVMILRDHPYHRP
jgi:23S rRNA (pseudouridine1915-N3)-methyltransferase